MKETKKSGLSMVFRQRRTSSRKSKGWEIVKGGKHAEATSQKKCQGGEKTKGGCRI